MVIYAQTQKKKIQKISLMITLSTSPKPLSDDNFSSRYEPKMNHS